MREEDNDYFDGPEIPETPKPPKEPKRPPLKPEDPRYWDQEEPEFEHLKPDPKNRLWWWIAGAGLVIGLLIAVYLRWFQPYGTDAVQYGYVEEIEHRGVVFKTFEGTILPYKNLMDTTRVYDGDFKFSTKDEKLAVKLRRAQYENRPVRVVYDTWLSEMPWHGESCYIITAVDSVDESKILPPDRRIIGN